MQGTVSLSHKTSYERKAWRKEERESDTQKRKRAGSKTEKKRNKLEMIKRELFSFAKPWLLIPSQNFWKIFEIEPNVKGW